MQRLWVVLLLGLVACSSGGTETTAAAPATDLVIEFVPAEGAAPQRTALTCEPAGGEHPDPEQACADLMASADPFAPLPADAICTQVFGGPQRAAVSGTYRGEPVRVELSRIDGCRIAQWDSLGAVLPPVA
jgi:hypothetical protein